MGTVIKELVQRGHDMAADLNASCGAVDVRSVAKLISDLASQLDVQLVRGNQIQQQLAAVVAENAGLKGFGKTLSEMHEGLNGSGTGIQGEYEATCQQVALDAAMDAFDEIKTPATDAFLAEVRAQAIESLLTESFRADIAGALADFDGMDEQSLQTLIWSGQPPEPDGDVWCVEYMSRAAAVLRKVREFAARLRKGAAQ